MTEQLAVGARVRRQATGEVGIVRGMDADGLIEVAFIAGTRLLDETELAFVPDDPIAAILEGELGPSEPFGIRLQALYLQHAYRHDPLAGLSNARIEPTMHQIYVAHRVVSKLRPRMVLADEVGLGKTIEAGLIIKELRARELIDRVLIVVPASLQHQWQQELRSKFNEEFEILDGPSVRFLARGGENPWSRRRNVICSLSFASNPRNAERIVEAGWDLVVFDEAHRVRRRREGRDVRSTRAYNLADELKELTNGMLLLTATPMQLHPFELYSLVELVEPGLLPTYEAYDRRRRELPRLNQLMRELVAWDQLDAARKESARSETDALLGAESGPIGDLAQEQVRRAVMDALVELHPLSDTLVRNRKAEIGGFTSREAVIVPVDLAAEELQLYEDVSDYIQRGYNRAREENRNAVGFLMTLYQKMLASSSNAIRASFIRRIVKLREQQEALRAKRVDLPADEELEELRDAEEQSGAVDLLDQYAIAEQNIEAEILELQSLVDRLGKGRDSKARELVRVIRQIDTQRRGEKILIFTQYVDTQLFLRATLEANGFEVAIFNGQLKPDEKEAAVRRFRGPAQILVSTEAGGEGRNFQFAHVMFNYDMPWNPMKVEQRIGRLDRIGQKRPVFIYNLACEGTVEERILEVLHKRIGLFRESVGSLDPILGEIERDIERLVLGQLEHFDEAFDDFARSIGERVAEARQAERLFSDFILDRASFRRDATATLLAQPPLATPENLRDHVMASVRYFGGLQSEHPDGGHVISLSPQLMAKLRVREPTHRGIYIPREALEREDLAFFAVGHELIDGIVNHSVDSDPVITGRRSLPDLEGGPYLEVYYELEAKGFERWGMFLRHLVDATGTVEEWVVTSMPEIGRDPGPLQSPTWLGEALAASQEALRDRLTRERAHVQAKHAEKAEEEVARAARIFDYRSVRLRRIIEDESSWIANAEASGNERERRILPARRGRLEINRRRLQNLATEHAAAVEEIRSKRPEVSAEKLAAALVLET